MFMLVKMTNEGRRQQKVTCNMLVANMSKDPLQA